MHPRSLILVALFCATGAAATETVRIDCKPAGSGPCATPPAPPAPPLPPTPAVPAIPAIPPIPAVAAVPAVPALPAPPPPPPALPDVPDEAHAACAGKATGSKVSLRLGPRETMSGLCERVGGKMVFQLRSYRLND